MMFRFRLPMFVTVFVVAAAVCTAAPAVPATENLAGLLLDLQGKALAVRPMLSSQDPADSLAGQAYLSLTARIAAALAALEARAIEPIILDPLLDLVESSDAPERAVFAPLLRNLANDRAFQAMHERASGDAGMRLQRLANELQTQARGESGIRPPLGRAALAAELRPALDLRRAPPRIGTITGGFNLQPMKLTFDRVKWTIEGGINLQPVGIRINHEAHSITGGANQAPVQISFDWSPERILLRGGVNNSPLEMAIDWQKGTLVGYANHSPLRIDFDMEAGTLKGFVNHQPISLTFDKVTGVLKGGINLRPVEMTLVNLDLFDFLTHFYLFVK